MARNTVIETILFNLGNYVSEDNIRFFVENTTCLYSIKIDTCEIKIFYDLRDDFYKITIEKFSHNKLDNVVFLTKSKTFHKAINQYLKNNNLSKHNFLNHTIAYTQILKKYLDLYSNLECIETFFVVNLKFDGIFV